MTNPAPVQPEPGGPTSRSRLKRMGAGMFLVGLTGGLFLWWANHDSDGSSPPEAAFGLQSEQAAQSHTAPDAEAPAETETAETETASPDEAAADGPRPGPDRDQHLRELIIGRWQQYYHGERVLTVREDGTASMVVHPAGVWAYVLAERLQFEIEWRIEGGRAIFHSTSGTPKAAFQVAVQMWGRRVDRPIVELNENRFVLLKEEDDTKSEWTRVERQKEKGNRKK